MNELEKKTNTIFTLLNEEKFDLLDLFLKDLDLKDSHGVSLLEFIREKHNQKALDYIYKFFEKSYSLAYGHKAFFHRDEQGRTLLHWALLCRQPQAVIIPLVNAKSIDSYPATASALHLAVIENDLELARRLIEFGANVNDHGIGFTPLLLATERNSKEMVDLLLDWDEHIDFPLSRRSHEQKKLGIGSGYTPLCVAAKLGYKDIAEKLLNKKARMTHCVNPGGYSPLHLAAQAGHAEIVRLFIERGFKVDTPAFDGGSALLIAIAHNQVNVAKTLLEFNANGLLPLESPHHSYRTFGIANGETAFHAAIKLGCTEIVAAFLDKNPNIKDISGLNAMHIAANYGQCEIMQMLLDRGFDINMPDEAGATPLLYAAEHNHPKMVKLLIEKGADPNLSLRSDSARHKQFNAIKGDTPLHIASKNGFVFVIGKLRKSSQLNLEAVNNQKLTPAKVAMKDMPYAHDLKLLERAEKINHLPDNYSSAGLFGSKATGRQLKEAIAALKAVVFDGAKPDTLKSHEHALNSKEIKSVWKRYR